jgi:HEAT repeat protein
MLQSEPARYRRSILLAGLVLAVLAPARVAGAAEGPDVIGDLDTALNGMTRARVQVLDRLAGLDAENLRRHKVLDVLVKQLATNADVNPRVRVAAISALAKIIQRTLPDEKQAVVPNFTRMLKDVKESLRARKESARGLGKLAAADDVGDSPAIRALESIASNEREEKGLRAIAIEALGRIGHESSFTILKKLLAEDEPVIRRKVAVAISSFLKQHKPDLNMMNQILKLASDKGLDTETRVDFLIAVGRGGQGFRKLSPKLVEMLVADDEAAVHAEIVKALARIGDAAAVSPLIAAYKRFKGAEGSPLRALVCEALGEFYEPLATSKSPAAARAIKDVTAALVNALNEDANADVCAAGAFALGNAPRKSDRSRAVASLIEALTDKDRNVKASALNSLTELTDQELGEDVVRWRNWYKKNERSLRFGR